MAGFEPNSPLFLHRTDRASNAHVWALDKSAPSLSFSTCGDVVSLYGGSGACQGSLTLLSRYGCVVNNDHYPNKRAMGQFVEVRSPLMYTHMTDMSWQGYIYGDLFGDVCSTIHGFPKMWMMVGMMIFDV